MAYFKTFTNIFEFTKVVRPLRTHELEQLGIYPSNGFGNFPPERLEELVEFCQKHKKYHVISSHGGFMHFNQIFPWADCYRLAQGNKDPLLAAYPSHTIDEYLECLSFELLTCERLAESSDLGAVKQLIAEF